MEKIRLQIISDLHLEMPEQRDIFERMALKPAAPILIVAGDTGELAVPNRFRDQGAMKSALDSLSRRWEKVYMIPGNHEFWGSDLREFPDSWFSPLAGYQNIFMGNKYYLELGEHVLIFATLWSEIKEKDFLHYRSFMDFKRIHYYDKPLPLSVYNSLYESDLAFIEHCCKKFPHRPKVLITHHLPHPELIPRLYRDSPHNDGYASWTFVQLHGRGIKTWIFGHSHQSLDKEINGCRFLSNAWGFSGENQLLDRSMVLELL